MKLRLGLLLAASGLLFCAGCFQAPKSIDVQVGSNRPQPVDSSRVPDPRTLEEARRELRKAYANIQWLEDEVGELGQDKAKYKRERDKYKQQRDECKDRLEKYEDD